MPEEIRSTSINRPRRVRSLSREEREEREENRDRFARELAQAAHEGSPGHRDDARSDARPETPEPETQPEPDTAAPPAGSLGRNLDITT